MDRLERYCKAHGWNLEVIDKMLTATKMGHKIQAPFLVVSYIDSMLASMKAIDEIYEMELIQG